MEKLRVTVLCDNISDNSRLKPEHGFSVHIARGDSAVLADVGASDAFLHNARALGIDPAAVNACVLSHNHYDHTGGVAALAELNGRFHLYLSQHFFKQSGWLQAENGGTILPTSGPLTAASLCERGIGFRYLTTDVFELPEMKGAYVLGNIPRTAEFERIDESDVVYRNGAWSPDDYRDELALAVKTEGGLVVLTGCAHTGVCSIIACAEQRLGERVCAAIGGTHLIAHDETIARETARWLKAHGLSRLVACHCTGELGFEALCAEGFEKGFCGWQGEF